MNMKWLTITICWSATTFPKSGTKKQDENAQYCTRPCHPEHTACVQDLCVWNPRLLTYFILDAEQTHCLIKQPQARGSVNMLARMTSGREQEAREKIFAELLLWNMLPTSKLRTFWIRPLELIGLNLVKSSGLDAKVSWTWGSGISCADFPEEMVLSSHPLSSQWRYNVPRKKKIFQLWNVKRNCCYLFFKCWHHTSPK